MKRGHASTPSAMPGSRAPKKLLVLTAVVLALAFVVVWEAGSVLSRPARAVAGEPPADLVGCRRVEFPSESGAILRGWYAPGRARAGAVALMHGVHASRVSMTGRARFLSRAGFAVLLFDFQAHGESTGDRITFGYLESRDAQAAIRFLRAVAPGERVGVIGVSMGGAAALLAQPPLQTDALVLEMVYPTIDEAITNRLTMRLGGWARVLTPLLTWQFEPRLGIASDRLRPIEHANRTLAPKLFIAGAEDRHTTLAESERLYESAAPPKELWTVAGAGHVDLHAAAPEDYERRVGSFLRAHLTQR